METMKEPEFDINGYPTEATLEAIEKWDSRDLEGLLRFIASAWHWPEYAKTNALGFWVFATGGWSGNESLLTALKSSMAWKLSLAWDNLSLPGGLLILATTKEARHFLNNIFFRYITEQAWKIVEEG